MSHYLDLPREDQEDILNEMYHDDEMTFGEIAEELETRPMTIRVHAKKFGMKIRTRTEQVALRKKQNGGKYYVRSKEQKEHQQQKMKEYWTPERCQGARDYAWEYLHSQPEKMARMAEKHSEQLKKMCDNGKKLQAGLLRMLEQSHEVHEYYLFPMSTVVASLFIEDLQLAIYFMGPKNPVGYMPVLEKTRQDLLTERGVSVINIECGSESHPSQVETACQMIDKAISDNEKQFIVWIGV